MGTHWENGTGKTTLTYLKVLLGLLQVSSDLTASNNNNNKNNNLQIVFLKVWYVVTLTGINQTMGSLAALPIFS